MKEVYIITNHDNDYSTAKLLSEEQRVAMEWLIDLADLNYSVVLARDFAEEVSE